MTNKWWLINDKTIQTIRIALIQGTIPLRANARHVLDTEIHKTNSIPDDWKKEVNEEWSFCAWCGVKLDHKLTGE